MGQPDEADGANSAERGLGALVAELRLLCAARHHAERLAEAGEKAGAIAAQRAERGLCSGSSEGVIVETWRWFDDELAWTDAEGIVRYGHGEADRLPGLPGLAGRLYGRLGSDPDLAARIGSIVTPQASEGVEPVAWLRGRLNRAGELAGRIAPIYHQRDGLPPVDELRELARVLDELGGIVHHLRNAPPQSTETGGSGSAGGGEGESGEAAGGGTSGGAAGADKSEGEAERQLRPAQWFHAATGELLNADALRRAVARGRLRQSQKHGGRWQHSIAEVCAVWPQHAERIEVARKGEATT